MRKWPSSVPRSHVGLGKNVSLGGKGYEAKAIKKAWAREPRLRQKI